MHKNKSNFKKALCLALALMLTLSVFVIPASAADIVQCPNGVHTDKNGDMLCDACGVFTGKITGLKVLNENSNGAKLVWDKVEGADGYKVFLYNEPDYETYAFDDTGALVSAEDDDFGLSDNIEIYDVKENQVTINDFLSSTVTEVVVCAYKTMGRVQILGDDSKVVTIHTLPEKVAGLKKSEVLATSVRLTWDVEISSDVKYRVYMYNNRTNKWDKIKTTAYSTYKVTGLKKNTTYKFRVDAYYKYGKKTYTGKSSKTLTVTTGDTQLNFKSTKLATGAKKTLYVDGTNKKVTWSTSDKSIVTVDKNGVIKGKKAGKATITAKVGKKKYTCEVQVKKPNDYLKWYFKKYDTIATNTDTALALIEYNDGKYEFTYMYMPDDMSELTACTMSFKPGAKKAKVEIAYLAGEKSASAETKLQISKYTGEKYSPSYTLEREGMKKSKAEKKCNEILADSFAMWNKLLKKQTGVTMKGIGFTAYTTK